MQLVTLLGCLVLVTAAAAALRLWLIIPGRTPGKKVARRRNACRTLIVLGSGKCDCRGKTEIRVANARQKK